MKQFVSVLVGLMLASGGFGNDDIYTLEDIYSLEEVTCTLPRIEGASFTPYYTTYTVGSATKVTCTKNRVINGKKVLKCLPTGKWEGSLPECRLKTTVPPPTTKPDNRCHFRHLSNGFTNIVKERYDLFETVLYSCNTGFLLRGSSTSECSEGGVWSSKLPTCEVGCLTPKIENGFALPDLSLHNEYFRPGQTVIFRCDTDFLRRGALSAKCTVKGQWSVAIPTCNKKTPVLDESYLYSSGCPTLTIDNGKISPSLEVGKVTYDFGSMASINCSAGYVVSGSSVTKCQSDGTWSNVFSSCKPGCPMPSIEHGSVTVQLRGEYDYYGINDVTTFVCEEGYTMAGSKYAKCLKDGSWSKAIPHCIMKPKVRDPSRECDSPIIEHGSVLSRPPTGQKTYLIGDKAFISCNEGYSREKVFITCLGENKWDLAEVMCKVIKPPSGCVPPKLSNGAYFPRKREGRYSVGTSITYICNKDYKRVGGSRGKCELNGKWSQIPMCIAIPPTCVPPNFPHGSYSLNEVGGSGKYTIGATLVFECDSGYKIVGSQYGKCNSQRKWTNIPSCRVVPPPECIPPEFPNGSYSRVNGGTISGDNKYTVGTTLLFKCDSGYKISGSQYGTCNSQIKWSQVPSCRAVPPPKCIPPAFPNGSYSLFNGKPVDIYKVGTTLIFKCNSGYKLSGSQFGTCNSERKWNQIPKCKVISIKPVCHSPQQLNIGSYSPVRKVYAVGNTITWTCRNGYKLRGAKKSTCRSNGMFSPLGQRCEVIVIVDIKPTQPQKGIFNIQRQACTAPQLSEGLKMEGESSFIALGKEIKFHCEDGYNMIGSAIRICRRTGFEQPPICERVKCQPPRLPQNSQFVAVKEVYHPGDRVEYVCDDTFIMRGQNFTVCQSDAQFLPQPPACLPPSCRKECEYIEGRSCQCHAACIYEDNCCIDFDQHCRKLFY